MSEFIRNRANRERYALCISLTVMVALAFGMTLKANAAPLGFSPTLDLTADDTQAGSPASFKIVVDKPRTVTEGSDSPDPRSEMHIRDYDLLMAPGVMGDVGAALKCSEQQARSDTCPPESLVGRVKTTIDIFSDRAPDAPGNTGKDWLKDVPVEGKAFLGEPAEGKHARIWFIIYPIIDRYAIQGCFYYEFHNVCDVTKYNRDDLIREVPVQADVSRIVVGRLYIEGAPIVIADDIEVTSNMQIGNKAHDITDVTDAHAAMVIWNQTKYRINSNGFRIPIYPWTRFVNDDFPDFPDNYNGDITDYFVPSIATYDIRKMEMELDGRKGADIGHPFLRNPTSCGPHTFNAGFTSWPFGTGGDVSSASPTATADFSGCDRAPFKPEVGISLSSYKVSEKADIKMTIKIPPRSADLSGSEIVFPKFSIDAGGGPTQCNRELPVEQCPQSSILARLRASSPLLERDTGGAIYLRSIGPDGKLGMTLHFTGWLGKAPLNIDVEGKINIDRERGIVSEIAPGNAPQVPISELEITIPKANSMFKNPSKPGTYNLDANLTGWNGATQTSSAQFTIEEAEGKPEYTLQAVHKPAKAGRKAKVTLRLVCGPRSCPKIKKATFKLPGKVRMSRLLKRAKLARRLLKATRGCKVKLHGRKLKASCKKGADGLKVDVKRGLTNPPRAGKIKYSASYVDVDGDKVSVMKAVRIRK